MKRVKRLFAAILACICLSAGFAACDFTGGTSTSTSSSSTQGDTSVVVDEKVDGSEGLNYVLSKDKSYYLVTGMGTCTDEALVIPSTYKGLPVKEIRYGAFAGQAITSLVVPDGVTKIGDGAFASCKKLLLVDIGDSVETIDKNAFQDCNLLMRVKFPKNLKSIGDRAFVYCVHLVEIYNESSYNVLADDSGVRTFCLWQHKSVSEPSGLTFREDGYVTLTHTDGTYLVAYLGEETELVIPQGITRLSKYALYNNAKITSVQLPAGLTHINNYAFSICSSLQTLTIPSTVVFLGLFLVENSLGLQGVVFENPQGWYYASSKTATSGTDVSEAIMADAASALETLKTNQGRYFLRTT